MGWDLFESAASARVRVALPVPVDRLFDYEVPGDLAREAEVGRRVRAPFSGRRLTGVIVALGAGDAAEPARRLLALDAILDPTPALPAPLLAALVEEARATLCPVGVALAAALPPGASPESERGFALSARGREAAAHGAAPGAAGAVLEALRDAPRSARALARAGGTPALLASLERERLIARTLIERGPRARPARVRVARLADGVDAEVEAAALARAPRQAALLRRLAEARETETSALARHVPGAAAGLRGLVRRGLVSLEEREVALGSALPADAGTVSLTREQEDAVAAVGEAIRARRGETFLLHGVTGSGKTEVYLRAVAETLAQGRQALVLVPEIPLTHQILARLRGRFGDRLAVLHSGLTPNERLAQWERLRRGEVPIAVGARSALFAPIRDLGVIVIDEEHDAAYKSEEGFRYHARSLAARRARHESCPLVLGSATPALETRHAAERGRIRRLRLAHRIGSRPLPAVQLLDLAQERARLPRGRKLVLGPTLLRALRETLAQGAQSILFLNRRGFSTQIACVDCQHVARCKHCDIALTYHARANALRCHYCDYHAAPPEVCPACGSDKAALLGIGTERVEEEVRAQLPDARVARLDRDTAGRRGTIESVLAKLAAGQLDVLIGTQMVAKGHDFPGVRLVGVVNADLGLHLPDFRAAERTFQLLTQVAGRAGRGALPGRVILQTWSPDHYAIRRAAAHDYERFYADELRLREALRYPPVGRLALVRVAAADEAAARGAAERLAQAARSAAGADGPEVLGPAPAPIARLRGQYRFQLLLKHARAETLRAVGRRLREAAERLPAGVRFSIDLQPLDML
jgi:primosomal protein N' (replication factor Y) (superfamily II helicase)